MPRVLLIAYGNPLRYDDGLAWQVAEQIKDPPLPHLEIIRAHQLTPELAERLGGVKGVVFVDASQNGEPGTLHCEPVAAEPGEIRFSHQLTPGQLLSLAAQLYGASPLAFCVSLVGKSFEHGEGLSPEIAQALPGLLSRVRSLVREIAQAP